MKRRHLLMTGAVAGLLSGCGLQRNISDPIRRRESDPLEGGIGGTGIVGLLDGYGSLIINNRRIQTDTSTRYSDAYGWTKESRVEIGDALTIEAETVGSELVAKRVQILHPVIGVIALMSSDGRLAQINGIYVDIPRPSATYKVGDRVAVSGIWYKNRVLAKKITPAWSQEDVLAGEVTRGQSITPAFVGSTQIKGARNRVALTRNSFVIARGLYDFKTGIMGVKKLRPGRFTGDAGSLSRLSVDGYLVRSIDAPGIKVSGLGHSLSRNTDLSDLWRQRVLLEGIYDGTFRPSVINPK